MEKNNTGFTLIELIVVIAISLIFFGFTLARYNDYSSQLKLKNEAKKIIDVLELTKKKAISSDLFDKNCANFSGYRVTISAGSYVLLFGCALDFSSIVQTYNLPTNITVITGQGNYDFPSLMINPLFISDRVRFKDSRINKCVDISISTIGIIELNEALISCP